MEQSISFKIGKGSIAHNARDFTASNVDSNRSQYNIEYVNKDLKQTYHELFDDAVTKYNARQTRSDRTIPNYYEKYEWVNKKNYSMKLLFKLEIWIQ